MPSQTTLLLFAGASLALALVPGPAVIYIVSRAIGQGRGAGLLSSLGVAGGGLVHVAAAAIGLSVLVTTSALAFSLVKYGGAIYLVYLGIRRVLSGDPRSVPGRERTRRSRLILDGAAVQVLNPKTALFFYAFLPQFVDPARGAVVAQTVVLGLAFVAIAYCSDSCWALLAGTGAGWLRGSVAARATRYLSGTTLLVLGVAAAVARPARSLAERA